MSSGKARPESLSSARLEQMIERLTWMRRRQMPAHYRAVLERNIATLRAEQERRRRLLLDKEPTE